MLLLCGAEHSYRDALQATDKSVCPKHVVKAYQYMVANARENITIEDLTRLTGVSGRALYEGFRRFKGASPMACLRAIRMQAIRKELLEGEDSDDVTVDRPALGIFSSRPVRQQLSENFRREALADAAATTLSAVCHEGAARVAIAELFD